MKPVIFLLYNNLLIYQVLCTLIYRRRSLYSFLSMISIASGNENQKYFIWWIAQFIIIHLWNLFWLINHINHTCNVMNAGLVCHMWYKTAVFRGGGMTQFICLTYIRNLDIIFEGKTELLIKDSTPLLDHWDISNKPRLTHWGQKVHVSVSELGRHLFRQWLVPCTESSHYLYKCWLFTLEKINEIRLMVCCVFGTKPLHDAMLIHCHWELC